MIYCLSPELYPNAEQIIEEICYQDENQFEWKIARVKNGFFVKYFGGLYFKDPYFSCELKSGKYILVNNTNCIFIQDCSFEIFAEVRNVIKTGYTDDIWETFQEMFEGRLNHDIGMLESEIVKHV